MLSRLFRGRRAADWIRKAPAASLALLCVGAIVLAGTACPKAGHEAPSRQATAPALNSAHSEVAASLPAGTAPKGASFVWLKSRDQFNIAAWYFAPKAPKVKGALAPAVLLLHMRGSDKAAWKGLPRKLVDEGFAVLALDLRGHGESLDSFGRPLPLQSMQDSDYQNMIFDLGAGHDFLAAQAGVDPERLAIIGASIGANLGLIYCAGDRRVRTVVALSPGMNYRSLEPLGYMDGVDKRAIYLVAAKGDRTSADACEKLARSGNQEGVKSVRLFEGAAHGTDLFTEHPGFDDTIVTGWLLNTIPPRR
ncbi:alpha/beta fold hydrolase [bacterium]|nr:alpha/beta fold hydrolase [bacterium]